MKKKLVREKLVRDFFLQPTDLVAKELLGKVILMPNFKAIITETESYHGDDPASHASKKRTSRNEPMFLQGGHLYVYMIYGMYFCLNITTEAKDYPSAVLIRGVKIIEPKEHIIDGPGKLCRYLEINKEFDRLDLCDDKNHKNFSIFDYGFKPKFKSTPRIGISKNKDALLRFISK